MRPSDGWLGAPALVTLVLVIAAVPASPPVAAGGVLTIDDLVATPYMDGSRIVFTWTTDVPATTKLYWGSTPEGVSAPVVNTNVEVQYVANQVGTQHLAVLYLGLPGETVYFQAAGSPLASPLVEVRSPLGSVVAANGPSRFDVSCPDRAEGCYTFNVYVRFDRDVLTTTWPVWQERFERMAVRVNDMTDGWGRLGRVVMLDSLGAAEDGWTLCNQLSCMSDGDIIIHSKVGYDSHTILGGIERGAPIALGFTGQLVVAWEGAHHFGGVAAHEFGHYAFWLDDQYDLASGADTCLNTEFDISIMNNNNRQTEIDSAGTPCAWQNNGQRNSWDNGMRPHYPMIPTRVGAPDPGPETDGGAFGFVVVNRGA